MICAQRSRLIEYLGSFDSIDKGVDEIPLSLSRSDLPSAELTNRVTVIRHKERISSVSRQPANEGRMKDGVSARQMSPCHINIMLIDSETRDSLPLVL